MGTDELWNAQLAAFGTFLRAQRRLANLSLREMAGRTSLSNAYLSQIERGLHTPSVRVLRLVADALDLSVETLLAQAGLWGETPAGDAASPDDPPPAGEAARTEAAIRNDPLLTDAQKEALLSVYRSYIAGRGPAST
ncbi:MAG: helix-turn-helix domain-containing protein [Acidimicrobiales bacterium]